MNDSPIRVVIPSYRRPQVLREKTLALLADRGQDPELVDVWLADVAEMSRYQEAVAGWGYARSVTWKVGLTGLAAQRNSITGTYPEGARLVSMDDDVEDVMALVTSKLEPVGHLPWLWEQCFDTAIGFGASLWGVYPSPNAFYMSTAIRTGLWHVVGSLWGVVNTHDPHGFVTLEAKEDYERSIQFYEHDGTVCRFDYLTAATRYYAKGGLSDTRSPESVEREVRSLEARWPELIRRNPRRKSGYPEIRLTKVKARG